MSERLNDELAGDAGSGGDAEFGAGHVLVRECVGEYLAGGLSGEERGRFEVHVAACAECARLVDETRTLETTMMTKLGGLNPDGGFEDRLVEALRSAPLRMSELAPGRLRAVRRAVLGVAAAVVIGGIGLTAMNAMDSGRLPLALPGMGSGAGGAGERWAFGFIREGNKLAVVPTASLLAGDAKPGSPGYGSPGDVVKGKIAMPGAAPSVGTPPSPYVPPEAGVMPSIAPGSGYGEAEKAEPGGSDVGLSSRFYSGAFDFTKLARGGEKPADRNDSVLLQRDELEPPPAKAPASPGGGEKSDASGSGAPMAGTGGGGGGQEAQQVVEKPAPAQDVVVRKVIRSGVATYEVEGFEVAFGRVSEIVVRGGGFVGGSSSEKLANGKVRGVITLRVPPEGLDGVLVALRGIGELKSQSISSSDVTRQFVDSEGQLRAARAVEARLLEIIRTAKGTVKELVAVEKELGEWRTKIETLEGELRYLNSQVSLSTLVLTVMEKEISAAAVAVQTEEVSAAIEAADVGKARDAAIAAVGAAKGRVIESELRQAENGQVVGKLIAEVPQEASAGFVEVLRSLGTVARLEVQKKQTTQGEVSPGGVGPRVETKLSRVEVMLVAQGALEPKVVQVADVAVVDVGAAYEALIARAKSAGGSVKAGSIVETPEPANVTASLRVEVPAEGAEAFLAELRGAGLVQRVSSKDSESARQAGRNVTESRRGFVVSLSAAARLSPREVKSVAVEFGQGLLAGAGPRVVEKAKALGARIEESSGSVSPDGNGSYRLVLDLPASVAGEFLDAVRAGGKVLEESTTLAVSAPTGPLARTRITVALSSSPQLVPADQGATVAIRKALATSALGLLWSLQLLVIGLCLVLPWAAVIWVGSRIWRRRKAAV